MPLREHWRKRSCVPFVADEYPRDDGRAPTTKSTVGQLAVALNAPQNRFKAANLDAPMAEHRFDVFGVRIAVASTAGGWTAFLLGSDGKRRPADIIVPSFIEEQELGQYLADLLHELATLSNNNWSNLSRGDGH